MSCLEFQHTLLRYIYLCTLIEEVLLNIRTVFIIISFEQIVSDTPSPPPKKSLTKVTNYLKWRVEPLPPSFNFQLANVLCLVTQSCLCHGVMGSLSVTPWPVASQAPLSIGFSRQEYWSGLPCPPPRVLPTQGSNPGLLHCRWILYCLSHQGSPRTLEWVAYPFSSGTSPPRN